MASTRPVPHGARSATAATVRPMARPTVIAAEASVDLEDCEPRFDRSVTAFRGFDLLRVRRFRLCFWAEFFVDRFSAVRFAAPRLTVPRLAFAGVFAMHSLRGGLSKRFASVGFVP